MQISIGLPATIPGVSRELLFDWARKADAGPFASLGIIGRLLRLPGLKARGFWPTCHRFYSSATGA